MITIFLDKYGWEVYVLHVSTEKDENNTIRLLHNNGCDGEDLVEATEHICGENHNVGLTHTNMKCKKSIVVICRSTSNGEMINTTAHELFHVVAHICGFHGISMTSEEPCYLMGWLCQKTLD